MSIWVSFSWISDVLTTADAETQDKDRRPKIAKNDRKSRLGFDIVVSCVFFIADDMLCGLLEVVNIIGLA